MATTYLSHSKGTPASPEFHRHVSFLYRRASATRWQRYSEVFNDWRDLKPNECRLAEQCRANGFLRSVGAVVMGGEVVFQGAEVADGSVGGGLC